jgi:uncharacterized protein (DUF1778 family)
VFSIGSLYGDAAEVTKPAYATLYSHCEYAMIMPPMMLGMVPTILATEIRQKAMAATNIKHRVTKETKVGFRTTAERKACYEHAAELRGLPFTAFAEQVLDEAAERVIAEAERIQLTARDCTFLMELLANPLPEPPPAFVRATEDFKASQAAKD